MTHTLKGKLMSNERINLLDRIETIARYHDTVYETTLSDKDWNDVVDDLQMGIVQLKARLLDIEDRLCHIEMGHVDREAQEIIDIRNDINGILQQLLGE